MRGRMITYGPFFFLFKFFFVNGKDFAQAFLGTFEDWFFKFVLGIQPTSPAFASVSIAPAVIKEIPSASGWTMKGWSLARTRWTRSACDAYTTFVLNDAGWSGEATSGRQTEGEACVCTCLSGLPGRASIFGAS